MPEPHQDSESRTKAAHPRTAHRARAHDSAHAQEPAPAVNIPEHPLICPLGFVDDDVRDALLSRAKALVMPSPFESLSMVLLEAWNRGLPALVNARCKVLRGQVERANGGLYYGTAAEFMAALDYLIDRPDDARQFGQQGLAYVNREYRWPTVMEKIETILQR